MKNTIAKIRFFLIISLVSVGLFSCLLEENFPDETVLTFQDVQFFAFIESNIPFVEMIVNVRFEDGDGNLGTIRPDTAHNLFVHVFNVLSDNTVVPMQISHNEGADWEDWIRTFNVPDLGPGPVSGTFNIRFLSDFPLLQHLSQQGQGQGIVQFKIYVYDRAGDRSNELITPNININVSL